jgi:hypothetical protein
LSSRPSFRLVLLLLFIPIASGCAAARAPRHFSPATVAEMQDALAAWSAADGRAASLPACRLLYDARMASGVAAVPGTLAVTYDGRQVERASLTGPFGSSVAEYHAGAVTGQDRRALVVDPETLRAVLAGTWPGTPSTVAGCDGPDCLLVWNGSLEVEAVVDRTTRRVRSLRIAGNAGRLSVAYEGDANPWPERIVVREERAKRVLALKLVAVEPAQAPGR